MNQKHLIFLNTFASYTRLGIRTLIGLGLAPYVLSCVGVVANGLYLEVMALVGLMMVLDVGISAAVMRYVAHESALGQQRACQEIWVTSLVAYAVPTGLTLLILVPAAPWLADWLHPGSDLHSTVTTLLLVATVMLALEFPSNAYRGVLLGLQRQFAISAIEIGSEVARAILTIVTLKYFTHSIVWVLIISVVTTLAGNLALALIVHTRFRWARFDRTAICWNRFSYVLKFSIATFVAQVGYTLNLYMHRILIGILLGPAMVTIYVFMGQFREILENVVMHFANTMIPVAAKYQAIRQEEVLRALLSRGNRYALLMAGLLAAPLAAFAEPLLRIWLWRTPDFAHYAPLMQGLLAVCVLELTRGVSNSILVGMARVKLIGIANISGVFVDGLIAITLISTTHLGLYAMLISTGVAVFIRRIIIGIHVCRAVDLNIRRFVIHSVAAPLVPAVVAFLAGTIILHYFTPRNWVSLIASGTLAGLIGLLFALQFTVTRPERAEVLSPFMAVWRRVFPNPRPVADKAPPTP